MHAPWYDSYNYHYMEGDSMRVMYEPCPVMLRKFDSGVKVIQTKTHSDDEVFARISSLAQKLDALLKGISPSDAAFILGIAPALAKEHLLNAENKGLLGRDVSPDGFCFYINLFNEIDPQNIYSFMMQLEFEPMILTPIVYM
ncbi:vacuolar protein sorting-associated protein 36 [Hordeum vulgare]|nr:vacuolar protein sorting-associated protein 36 [Hordeum vulgare]